MKAWKKLLALLSFAVLSSGVLAACGPETRLSVKYMVGDQEYVVQKYDINDTIALPKDPAEEGKRFIGWYTDPECTIPYAEGSVTQGLTLYAKFEASVVFIVVNTNGGEKINMISVKPGEPYSVPDAVKPGHTFTGYYYVDENGEMQDFPSEGVLAEAKDIVIFASYTVNKYTVTLHNSLGEDEVVEVEYNKTYAPKALVRPGYTFVAWHTVENGQSEETIYDESKPITANVDLYAEYTANPYKITLVDGDTLETLDVVNVTYDSRYDVVAPAKEGYSVDAYTFNGEAFATSGSYMYASDIRVSVKYVKNSYTVTFVDTEGNTLDTQTVVHGEKAVVPSLNKVGYTYTLSANATEAVKANTQITVTYTANPYKLTITNNVNADKKVVDVVYNGDYALTADAISGYTFTKFTIDGEDFTASGKYAYAQNLSIVANYTKNSYTVTFVDTEGNTLDTQTVVHGEKAVIPSLNKVGYTYTLSDNATQAVTANTAITVTYTAKPVTITILNAGDTYTKVETTYGATFTLTAPERLGYIFQGFKSSGGTIYEAGQEYTCDFESLTLTAQWDGDDMKVYFVVGTKHEEVTVLKGYTVAMPATQPSKEGYTFQGWSLSKDSYEAYDFSKPVTEEFALYACFTPNTYYVIIDLDGGKGDTTVPVTYDAAYSLTNPTKKGYKFNGFVDAEGNAYTKTETYNVVGDTNLKATWTEDYKSVVFYVDDEENTQQVLNGFTVASPNAPEKAGYTFQGWSTKQAEFEAYDFTKAVTEDIALYAHFTPNSYYVFIDLDGGKGDTTVPVTYGGAYTLTNPTKKGYTFGGYVDAEGKAYTKTETYDVVGNTELKATWVEDYKDVIFHVGDAETTEQVLNGFAVAKPNAPEKEGYTFKGWSTKQGEFVEYNFNSEVTDTLALYAFFDANPYYIRVELDGGVGETQFNVVYGEAYTLTNPTKKGYVFSGYVDEEGKAYTKTETYDVAGNTYLKATWAEDRETVIFYADGATHFETTVLNGSAVSAPTTQPSKVGYTFQGWSTKQGEYKAYDFAGEVTDTLALYASFTPNVYTVTVYDGNGNVAQTEKVAYGTIPSINMNLTHDQDIFNGYYTKYDGQYAEKINFNVPYLYTEDLVVYQWWENPDDGKVTDDLKQNGDYFVENNDDAWGTYVFLVGHTYNFKATTIHANEAQDFATLTITDGNTQLVALKAGTFVVTVIKPDGTSYERTIKIVEKVFTFTTGEDYKGAWLNRNAKNWNNNEKGNLMTAGRNNFIPDVKVQKLENGKLVALDFASANVEYTVLVDGVATNDYTIVGNAFNFGSTIVSGSTITLTMSPRYTIYKGQTVTFSFVVNDAVNVYTSHELRRYYEDVTVSEINVLRNIKVELQADQLYYGNKPEDYNHANDKFYTGYSAVVPADLVAPKNTDVGSAAFDRLSGNIKVNGNYFTVDGSNIPLVDNRLGHYRIGDSIQSDLITQNVQFSIFKFGKDETPINDVMTMENLYVLGNMNLATNWGANDGETHTVTLNGQEKKVLTMSGAALGLQVRCANVNLDNVTIRRCTIGISTTSYDPRSDINPVSNSGHPINLYLKDCLIEGHWANDVYMYGFARATFDSCFFGVASGAAIHVDSIPSPIAVNPEVYFTNDTKVENWVAGSETWFTVYGMSTLVPSLKGSTEQAVSNATGGAATVLKNDGSQLFNFVFLMKGTPEQTEWLEDDMGKATVTVQGLNSLQEWAEQAVAVGQQYANDNIQRVLNGEITEAQLMAEADQHGKMWLANKAQSVRVAPSEMGNEYQAITSIFGEIVAYLGVAPKA